MDWLHSANNGPPSEESATLKKPGPQLKVKEEPPTPESYTSSASLSMVNTIAIQPEPKIILSTTMLEKKVTSSSERPQPIGASVPLAAPCKTKPKGRGSSILRSALEIPMEVKLLPGHKKA